MNILKKIPFLTLLGLVFPLGNTWGPYLVHVNKGSYEAAMRRKLVIFESLLTLVTLVVAISIMVRIVNQEPDMVPDVDVMMKALYVFLVQGIVILVVALILACCVKIKS